MARIRSFSPEVWTNEQLVNCSLGARLLWMGIQSFCDDAGIMPAKGMTIKMQVFPGDSFGLKEINGMLSELVSNELIVIYNVGGVDYLQVCSFNKLQKIDKPSYKYPKPSVSVVEQSNSNTRTFDEHSTNTSRMVAEISTTATLRSGGEWKGKEGNGVEGSGCAHAKAENEAEFFQNGVEAETESPPELRAAPPTFVEVAQQMTEYFTSDEVGVGQWQYMEGTAGAKVAPGVVCLAWAGKATPYELLHWKENVGRLVNWVATEARKTRSSVPSGKKAPSIEKINSAKYDAYA